MSDKPTFGSVPLTPRKQGLIDAANEEFEEIEHKLKTLPPSRLSAIALTKLEEASMWVNKAISRSE